jgi:hypothetical protein
MNEEFGKFEKIKQQINDGSYFEKQYPLPKPAGFSLIRILLILSGGVMIIIALILKLKTLLLSQ